jgi:hypothetical protein
MKFLPLPAVLTAALLSAVVVLPFLPSAKTTVGFFVLEAQLTTSAPGYVQFYYDDGRGFREALSARAAALPTADPVTLQFALPSGSYHAIRFDPLDRPAVVTLSGLRAISRSGRVLRDIPPSAFSPAHEIQSVERRGDALNIIIAPGGHDPQLLLSFPDKPLDAILSWRDRLHGFWSRALPVFAGLLVLLGFLTRAGGFQQHLGERLRRLTARPARAIGLTAAVAVIASAYPVVFLGKSYVSPNAGTVLLYDHYPTLPGYTSGETVDVKLSDVGAIMWQHVAYAMIQRRALAQGELPLWNRYNTAGVPLLAQGQSMFGDPLHLLVIAANGAAWAWDLKYLIAKWLFATALGLTVLTLLARKAQGTKGPRDQETTGPATNSLLPALIVAAATPFIGFFLYRLNHPAFFSLCYAPWILYAWIRLSRSSHLRSTALWATALLVANLALMNSGTVKEAYMLAACMNFSGACVLLASRAPWPARLLKLAAAAWAGVIFILLTAPVWATFLQTLKNSYTGYNAVSAYQIQPALLLGLFDEIFYRPLMQEDRVFGPSLNFLLLLGFLYFLATLRLQLGRRAIIALAASSVVPLALGFGLVPPHWIVTLPFLGNIAHLDNTFSCALIILWSVLAGIGFATAAQRLGTREGRDDLILGGLLLFVLVFGWIAFRQAAHRPILGPTFTVNQPGQVLPVNPFIWTYLASLLVASVVLAICVHRSAARRRFTMAAAVVVTLCATVLLWRHGLHAGSMGYEDFTARPTVRVNFHAKSEAMELARAAHRRDPGRGYGLHGNFAAGWTGVYGLETVHGADALVNPYLRELVGISGVERIWDWRLYADASTIGAARPFFDVLNVRHYFDFHSDQGALGRVLKLVKPADLDVYESPTAWPRAFFTDRVEVYDRPEQLMEKVNASAGRPFAAVHRGDLGRGAGQNLTRLVGDGVNRSVVPGGGYRLTENRTSFDIRASGPGVVVLSEAYWPGDSRARLNGRDVPVVRLNHAFKGVVVDRAGDYRVEFRYWPRKFTRYLGLSGLGAVLLVGSLGLAFRRSRCGPEVRAADELKPDALSAGVSAAPHQQ